MTPRLFAITLLPLVLTACSTVQNLPLVPGGDREEAVVSENENIPIHGWRIVGDDILVIRVPSNGCTQKADLTVSVRTRRGETQVTLGRSRDDYCRALVPNGVEIPFGFEELGVRPGANVTVMNPVQD
jgi:hypothetical protein